MLSEDKVIAKPAHEKAPGGLLAVGRHEKSAAPSSHLRHETERYEKRQRHIFEHHMRWPEYRPSLVSACNQFCCRHLYIEVRMLVIACRILTLGYVYGVVGHLLEEAAVDITVALLRYHVLDFRLLGVEIIVDILHLVALPLVEHLRLAHYRTRRVRQSLGKDSPGIHIIGHIICLDLHILVLYRNVAVKIDHPLAVFIYLNYGIPGGGEDRLLYAREVFHRIGDHERIRQLQRVRKHERIGCRKHAAGKGIRMQDGFTCNGRSLH